MKKIDQATAKQTPPNPPYQLQAGLIGTIYVELRSTTRPISIRKIQCSQGVKRTSNYYGRSKGCFGDPRKSEVAEKPSVGRGGKIGAGTPEKRTSRRASWKDNKIWFLSDGRWEILQGSRSIERVKLYHPNVLFYVFKQIKKWRNNKGHVIFVYAVSLPGRQRWRLWYPARAIWGDVENLRFVYLGRGRAKLCIWGAQARKVAEKSRKPEKAWGNPWRPASP